MTLSDRATSFGEVAEEYDRWRPSYPPEAVDWLAPAAPARVGDVGAGTGKLTELLLARGLEVDSVEPDERMLAVLGRNHPAARRHRASSTHIPVEDGALDAVLVADAWHWFDPEPTIAEVRRVLKAGGWLGLVWNVAAVPVEPWERALADDSDEYNRKTSMALALTPDDRAASFEESRSKLQRICDAQGKQAIPLRHIASCIRWTPRS